MKSGVGGRPSFKRNSVAGENLRTILKLMGKTWRKDVGNPNHVRNWSEWVDNGLPSSPTTIDRDMSEGVPETRLSAYASCLGTTIEALCSKRINWSKKLKGPTLSGEDGNFLRLTGLGEEFSRRNKEYNRSSYIEELFSLMGGVYRMNYLLDGIDLIHRSTFWIHEVTAQRMLTRGGFIMFGNENRYKAVMFRWHNNLHFHYLCENGMEFGYCMTVDPLRHNLVRQRKPFWLLGTGMTDRGLVDNKPITFVFRMEQLIPEPGMSVEELWHAENDDMRKFPFIAPGTPDYERVRTEVLTSDVLAPEVGQPVP